MSIIRLTEKHPLTQKLRELEDFMVERNIALTWNGHRLEFSAYGDTVEGDYGFVREAESNEECTDFPSQFSTKLIRFE